MTSGKHFNKGVKALGTRYWGRVTRETLDKIVVFGGGDERYNIIYSCSIKRNVLADTN